MREHAEQHGHPDDRHGTLGLGLGRSSRASSAKMTEASPRGPNHPTNATVRADSPEPSKASATGSMRITVRLKTA